MHFWERIWLRMSGRKSFTIRFGGVANIRTITVDPTTDPEDIRHRLRLPSVTRVIQMHVGADNSTAEILERLWPTFRDQLAPLAEKHQIAVIDGATTGGFVGMMGRARSAIKGTFPLIGVAPVENVLYPGGPTGENRYPLDEHHSHFVLVKGSGGFGIESETILKLGKLLSPRRVALLINGGQIVRREARMNAYGGTPLLVMEGSGRLADELALALKRGTSDDMLRETISVGMIRTCTEQTLVTELIDLMGLNAE